MKRIAIVAAIGLAGCSEDAGTADPNLWLAEASCTGEYLVVQGNKDVCAGRLNDHEKCIRDALSSYADRVCGLVAARVAVCGTKRAVVCNSDGSVTDISGVDCGSEVADYYACLDAKAKGRTDPWPIGGDADAGAADGGARDGSADGR